MYYAQSRYDEAIAAYQRAIALDPKYALPYNNLATIYLIRSEFDLAAQYYRQRIDLEPETALTAHASLGVIARHYRDDQSAAEQFQKALALCVTPRGSSTQSKAGALENRAIALLCMGRRAEALAALREAIAVKLPGDIYEPICYTLLRTAPHPPEGLEEMIALLQAAKLLPDPLP